MRIGLHPQNPLEWTVVWAAEKANLIEMPMIHGICFGILGKVFLTASRLGIFEAAKDSTQTIEQIAQKTGLNPKSLTSTMLVLTYLGYFKYKSGKLALTRVARKYCLKDSPDNLYNYNIFTEVMVDWMGHLDEYLKEGKGLGVHGTMTDEEWHWYQLGMEYMATATSKQAPKMTPMPGNPTAMLDIGGSHGLYCVELCKKYPTLKATILELPEAIEKARPILAKFNMGDRISYQAGNALKDDFGENRYDLVLMSSLMHHFTAEQDIEVSKKVAKALKPGGYFVIQEFLRPEISANLNTRAGINGILTDIIFNISSTSNTWSLDDLKGFQSKAGLKHNKLNKFKAFPSFVQVCAKKE
jgi:ubiquinone/menaquinone biosynthesis C-methylase UbiE